MSATIIRPTTARDLQPLRWFLARAFGTDLSAPFLNPALMCWKYWNGRSDWTGPRSFVVEKHGRITAHVGIWPVIMKLGRTIITGAQMIDWAATREHPASAVASLIYLADSYTFLYAIGGSAATRKILPAFGFREIGRQWRGIFVPGWRSAGDAGSECEALLDTKQWACEPSTPTGIQTFTLPDGSNSPWFPRSPAFIEYLYRCPTARFQAYTVACAGEAKAYVISSIVKRQARVVGMWVRRQTDLDGLAAYCLVKRVLALTPEVRSVVVTAPHSSHMVESAVAAGFQLVRSVPVQFFQTSDTFHPSPDFHFQMVDDDGSFLSFI